jgi:hypothetical protein
MATVSVVSETQAIAEIDAHIAKCGGTNSVWYCGVASDPRKRLFIDHNVDEKNGAWIHCDCGADTAARRVEDHFLRKGCRGGGGGGDRTTRHVYAYKITGTTRES